MSTSSHSWATIGSDQYGSLELKRPPNYTNTGWQRVHYIVYRTKKSIKGWGKAESITAFRSPVNCIVDKVPSNICYIISQTLDFAML